MLMLLLGVFTAFGEDARPLRSAVEISAMLPEEAEKAHSVELTGVLIYLRDPGRLTKFALQDETGGVTAHSTDAAMLLPLRVGDRVRVRGHTFAERRGVFVRAETIEALGYAGLPKARPLVMDDLLYDRAVGGLYEVTGTVRTASVPGDIAPARLLLGLGTSQNRLNVWVANFAGHEAKWAVDSVVKATGVLQQWTTEHGQPYATFLVAGGPEFVTVLKSAPGDPWDVPLVQITALRLPASRAWSERRQRVRGVVTWVQPGESLVVQQGDVGLRVALSEGATAVAGDEIEALGHPAQGEYDLVLEDASVRILGKSVLPAAVEIHTQDLAQIRPDGPELDSRRVRVQGVVVSSYAVQAGLVLEIDSGPKRIPCLLPPASPIPPEFAVGAVVSVVGVSQLKLSDVARRQNLVADEMRLGVNGIADVQILQAAPLWTAERLRVTVLSLCFVGAFVIAWAVFQRRINQHLRREIKARSVAEERLSGERRRLAADLHDTLEQTLLGTDLQLGAAAKVLQQSESNAALFVQRARQLLSRSRREVRDTVWDLHQNDRESATHLADALAALCAENALPGEREVAFTWEGSHDPVPSLTASHLIHATREALTNACKHAVCRRIEVSLKRDPEHAQLTVRDDGAGFAVESAPAAETGHFGLGGLRDRAAQCGGTFDIRSVPGEGTTLILHMPLSIT